MKSKKFVALALTAAMAVSMASMTAFAAVKYEDGAVGGDLAKLTATVTISKEDYDALVAKKVIDGTNGNVKLSDLVNKKYADIFGLDADYTKLNTPTKTFLGWSKNATPTSIADTGDQSKVTYADTDVVAFTKNTDGSYSTSKIGAVYATTADDKKINDNVDALNKAKEKEEAAKSRDEHLKEEDKNHNATDNINTGTGVETKPANVVRKTDPINPSDTNTSEYHDLKAAGVNVDANELAWVYEVTPPADFMSSTKNARVQLTLPDGYTTDNYKVTVYHVKGWCSKQKVTGLDVGKYDVTFWANDFSPYVLILTPKGATSTGTSTNNPGTGDFSAVPVALLAAAALGATGFVAYKKRKAE